jgi:hypothetical protein
MPLLRNRDPVVDSPLPGIRRQRWARPVWGVLSAVLVAGLVLAGGWLVVFGDDGDGAPRAAAPAPSSTPAPAPSPAPAEGGCPVLPFEDQSLPAAAPAAVWRPAGPSPSAAAAPSAERAGPLLDAAGVLRCYARTPVGALFAGANFLAAVSDPTVLEQAVVDLTVDGEGQSRLLLLYGFDPTAVVGTGGAYDVAGFAFLSTGLDVTTVAVVLRAEHGGMAAVPLTLVWSEGTWLVRLPDDGGLADRSVPLSSLAGYTAWGAR